jgi:hypothetical protein
MRLALIHRTSNEVLAELDPAALRSGLQEAFQRRLVLPWWLPGALVYHARLTALVGEAYDEAEQRFKERSKYL